MISHIRQAHKHVQAAREALQSTDLSTLVSALEQMQLAADCASQATSSTGSDKRSMPELQREIQTLKRDLGAVARLSEQGLALQSGWAAMIASVFSAYTENGTIAPLPMSSRVCLEG